MIDLTPLEVRKKKGDFRRGLRGYEPAQVDDFLDVVADRLEQLVRENMALNERVGRIDQQVADYRDREKALTEALVTAQQMRDEMRAQAAREADTERRRALEDAERIRADATSSVEREEEKLRGLKARQAQFLGRYQSFLRSELDEVSVMANSLGLVIGPTQAAPPAPAWAAAPAAPSAHPPPDTPQPHAFAPAPQTPAPAPPPPVVPPTPTPPPAAVPPTPAVPSAPPQDRPLRAGAKSPADDDLDERIGSVFSGWDEPAAEPASSDDELLLSEDDAFFDVEGGSGEPVGFVELLEEEEDEEDEVPDTATSRISAEDEFVDELFRGVPMVEPELEDSDDGVMDDLELAESDAEPLADEVVVRESEGSIEPDEVATDDVITDESATDEFVHDDVEVGSPDAGGFVASEVEGIERYGGEETRDEVEPAEASSNDGAEGPASWIVDDDDIWTDLLSPEEMDAAREKLASQHAGQAPSGEAIAEEHPSSAPEERENEFVQDDFEESSEEPDGSAEPSADDADTPDDIALSDDDDERTGDETDELFDLNSFGLSFGGQSAPASRPPSSDSLGLTLRPDGAGGAAKEQASAQGEDDDDSNDDPEDLFSSMFGDQR